MYPSSSTQLLFRGQDLGAVAAPWYLVAPAWVEEGVPLGCQVLGSCLHLFFPFHLSFLWPLLLASVLNSGHSEGCRCGSHSRRLRDLK